MVVTGANRGIGLGIAECCLINGAAKVYSIDFAATGEEFAGLEKLFPGRLFALNADVTKEASIAAAVDKIMEESGAIHGMVVNAGRTNHKSALDFTTEEIEGLFAVNVRLRSYFYEILLTLIAFWCILHRTCCSTSFHQAQYQGSNRLHCFHGILPS